MNINQRIAKFEHEPKKFACFPLLNKTAKRPKNTRGLFIVDLFFDVPMYFRHEGLKDLAWRKRKMHLHDLTPGNAVLFFNSDFKHIAIYGAFNSLQFIPAPNGERISNLFLQKLPEIFGQHGYNINYPAILKEHLIQYLDQRRLTRSREVKEISK